MIKKLKRLFILVSFIVLLMLCFIHSNRIIKELLDYSYLFFTKLAPSSFLFFLLSSLIIEYQLLDILSQYFKINASSTYLFIISSISGFPSGAKYTKELYEKSYLNLEEANKSLLYTHFPNPIFIFSSVYSLLNDYSLSLKIYLSIVFSNVVLFLFFKGKKKEIKRNPIKEKSFSKTLSFSLEKTFHTIVMIYGISLFFCLISSIITNYFSFSPRGYVLISGLFDLTKGIFSTSILTNNHIRAFFILFFLSFGSISIHMQTSSILDNTNVKYESFLKGRIIGTILSLLFYFILISA